MSQTTMNVSWPRGPGCPKKGASGHTPGTVGEGHRQDRLQPSVLPGASITPRLFNLDAAAAYLSMSPWTIRDLEAKGVLPRVRVPLPRGGELRKLLFDKADLDRLIAGWKETAA
jgi:hypothetical protein